MGWEFVTMWIGAAKYYIFGCASEDGEYTSCSNCGCYKEGHCDLEENMRACERSNLEHKILMNIRTTKCPHCGTVFAVDQKKEKTL